MAYKLDIFKLLGDLNNPRAGDIYAKLTDDERKGFAPLVVMRWMTGTSDEQQIMLINEFMNPAVFSLAKHPHLLMQILQATSSKTNKRYAWLGIKSGKKKTEAYKVLQEYFEISAREARCYNVPEADEVIRMATELGWQKDELAKLQKEFKE